MAAPTVFAVGAVASGIGAITPPLPGGTLLDNDVLVTIGESVGGQNYPGSAGFPPTGWAHVTGSPVVQDTNTQLTVIWKRFATGDTAPGWGDSGDHNVGRMIAIRGCKTTGNPWNVVASSTESTSDTSAAWPGNTISTTVADCLVLEIIATGADVASTAQLGALTNANLSSITERMDNWISNGNGGGIGMVSGVKASAGNIGSSTATLGTAATKSLMTLALEPPAAATNLVIQDATHAQTAANVALVVDLNIANATHAATSTTVALTQVHELAVANATHGQTADNLTLTTGTPSLEIQNATHAQTAQNLALVVDLNIANAAHAQTAQNIALTQVHNLTVANATHAQTAQNVALVIDLSIANAVHAQTAQNLALTQVHNLIVAGATHAQTAQNLALTQLHILAVQNAAHAQTAENVQLVIPSGMVGNAFSSQYDPRLGTIAYETRSLVGAVT